MILESMQSLVVYFLGSVDLHNFLLNFFIPADDFYNFEPFVWNVL